MHDDTLVIVEWYDAYIPPRHHMSVAKYGDAMTGLKQGYPLLMCPLDPELLIDERTAYSRR